jgi:anthranilate phosphoribosyltransferase
VLLNAAAILSVEDNRWDRGLAVARDALDSGAALATLEHWIAKSNSFAS